MYGISSLPFAHNQFFEARDAAKGIPMWTARQVRTLDVTVPEDQQALRAFGAALLKDVGIEGSNFGVYRPNATQLNVYSYSFRKSTQLKYRIDEKKLTVEDRRFRWDHFLTGRHARGGFAQAGFIQNSWNVVVDLVGVGAVLWIATGLYIWWGIRGHRGWGWIAILSGIAPFVWLIWPL